MIISIAGTPGSGKTSAAKIVAARLGFPFYSIGALRGKMAKDRGMTIDELNALGETESFTDAEVDEYQKSLGIKEDNFVIEGRLAWLFIPHSFKVFLACDPDEAAKRVFQSRKNPKEDRSDEPLYTDPASAKSEIEKRTESDNRRYQKYYGVQYQDPSHYDLVINTTDLSGPNITAGLILERLQS